MQRWTNLLSTLHIRYSEEIKLTYFPLPTPLLKLSYCFLVSGSKMILLPRFPGNCYSKGNSKRKSLPFGRWVSGQI